jgi:hypothetical protein
LIIATPLPPPTAYVTEPEVAIEYHVPTENALSVHVIPFEDVEAYPPLDNATKNPLQIPRAVHVCVVGVVASVHVVPFVEYIISWLVEPTVAIATRVEPMYVTDTQGSVPLVVDACQVIPSDDHIALFAVPPFPTATYKELLG